MAKETFAVNYYGAATSGVVWKQLCHHSHTQWLHNNAGTMTVTDTLLDLVKKSDNGRIVKYGIKRLLLTLTRATR